MNQRMERKNEMSGISIEKSGTVIERNDGGITLLEAYSALAGRDARRNPVVEIPFPGQPSVADPEGRFWTIKFKNVG